MDSKENAQDHRRWIWRSCLALTPALGLVGGTWLIAYLMLHPPTLSTGDTPSVAYQQISFTTSDGLTLWGWYVPGKKGATMILVHGFARDRSELLPEAHWLVENGYGALMFDCRAQGASDGDHISLGYTEALDVSAAADYILSRSPQERIGVIGYSMGAVAAIRAAARDTRLQAVIAVSPFATLRETLNHRLNPIRPLIPLIIWWGERMVGLSVDDLRPVDVIAELAPRPILIMQAGGDKMVPPDSGLRLYEAATGPTELWSVPGIGHVDFGETHPEAFKRRIIDFLGRSLPLD